MSVSETTDVLQDPGAGEGGKGSVVEWCESMFRWGLQAREPYEQRALRSIMFWAGDQWAAVEKDIVKRWGRSPGRPPYCESSRIIDNQLPIYIRQIASLCIDAVSDYEAVPATSDREDRLAAQLATKLIKVRYREDNEQEKRELEFLWLFGCGEVLRKTYFDPYKVTPDEQLGDIHTEVVDFFHYVKCPSSGDNWPPRWVIEFDARHVDWVRDRYGVKVEPEDLADVMTAIDSLAMNVIASRSIVREKERNSVILKRLYAPPTKKYPDGVVFVWANGKLLKKHPLQIPKHFPFSRAYWHRVPGRLYPLSYIEPLLSDQRQLNTILSQLQEMRNRQLRGDIVIQGSGEVTQRVLSKDNGQKVIRVPPGVIKWEFLDYAQPVRLAEEEYGRILRNLTAKSGLSEVAIGQSTRGQTTATELQLLRESGMLNIGFHMRNYDRHQCAVSSTKILCAKEFFTSARVLPPLGASYGDSVRYFFGSELRNTRDVVPMATPKLTPAMRRQLLAHAAQQGLLGPYTDPNTGLPNPMLEYAARTQLRNLGLYDQDEEIASRTWSYEELSEFVSQMTMMGYQAWAMQAMAAFYQAQLMMQQVLAQAQAAAMPEPEPGFGSEETAGMVPSPLQREYAREAPGAGMGVDRYATETPVTSGIYEAQSAGQAFGNV